MTDVNETPTSQATLRRYLLVLRRQWWVIAVVTLVAAAAATAYTVTKTPVYGSEMKIVVGQGQALFGADASNAFQPFTQTMTDLLESDIVARRVIEQQGLDMTPDELLGNMKVTSRPDTSVLDVTYEDTDRARSTRVLRGIGEVFTGLVSEQLAQQPSTPSTTGEETQPPVSATVFDPAHPLPGKVSPHVARTIVIALVLGLIAGILLAFLRDALSGRVRTQTEAEEAFGAQVVGLIPRGAVGTTVAQLPKLPPKLSGRISESLQLLSATLRYGGDRPDAGGVILVTSARPADGKSTVVAHLSATLARSGRSVVAVEADLHRSALHRLFAIDPMLPGLTDALERGNAVRDLLVPVDVGQPVVAALGDRSNGAGASDGLGEDEPQNVWVLPAGTRDGEPAQLLSLGESAEVVSQLRELVDYVVIDTPPLLASGDAFPLAQLSDTVVVVCREGDTSREEAREVRETLASIGVNRFSLVLTESSEATRRTYGYSYGVV